MSASEPPPTLPPGSDAGRIFSTGLRRRPRRICLLSGGGDAPGVNAIVRGFVHAAHRYGIEVLASRYGFEGLLDPGGLAPLSITDVRGILPRGGCVLGCSTRVNPFFVAVDGGATTRDMGAAIVDRLQSLDVEAMVLIGGDGTLFAARRFTAIGMPCVHVPKTIDNDLEGTDVSCGFESAVETAVRAIDALHSTAESHARVMLLEVMGRNAGAIALHAGVAGGADVILLPEIPYRLHRIIAKVRWRESLGLRFSIVVVAEGARPLDGSVLEVEAARPGHLPRLGGAGERLLADLQAAKIGHEVRLTVLGHLQRGGSPSAFDRNLGTQMGTFAAELCRERAFGRRIVLREGKMTSTSIGLEATPPKSVDMRGPLAKAAHMVGIELGDAMGNGGVE